MLDLLRVHIRTDKVYMSTDYKRPIEFHTNTHTDAFPKHEILNSHRCVESGASGDYIERTKKITNALSADNASAWTKKYTYTG